MEGIASGKVSVITPVYNRAAVLGNAIMSVLHQTYGDWEHLVVDDGSTDGSHDVVQSFAAKHARVKCLRNVGAKGAAGARNTGIGAATGQFIAFLDSDDLWCERKLEFQVQFMRAAGAIFTYGDYTKVAADTRDTIVEYSLPEKLTYQDLLLGCPIGCLTVAYDQQALGKLFMPGVRAGQDWALWLAITRKGVTARKYPGREAVYTAQEKSLSSNKVKKVPDIYRIYREYEGLSVVKSLGYLFRHVLYAARKP